MRIQFRSPTPAVAAVVALGVLLTACGTAEPVGIDAAAAPDETAEAADDDTEGAADDAGSEADTPDADAADAIADAPTERSDTGSDGTDCSARGAAVDVQPVEGMPAEVAATRDLLVDAALRCDEQLLFTAIEESDMFTYSFGDEGDAIGYWWDLEAAGEAPFLRLAQVLGTTPSTIDEGGLWTWPRVHTGRSEDTTDDAWAELTWLEDVAAVRAAPDGYLDWRVGISEDGQWRFFVAGD